MELIFLGTGAGVPSKGRNVTSIALTMLNERNAIWLFDCGEATQHQVLHSQVKLSKIEKIFITHLHGDHIFGLPGLLSSRSFQGGESTLTVYGPKGIQNFIETSLKLSGTHLTYELKIEEIESELIFEDSFGKVTAMELDHGVQSFGYRIEEADKPGALDAERLIRDGVSPGPSFKILKEGGSLLLPDGRTINGNDYIGEPQKGRVLAIFGDTRSCKNENKLAYQADLIVHEATFEAEKGEMAAEYMHSTTAEAAELARDAEAKRLIITHISSRYDKEASLRLVEEAREIFQATDIANDFDVFEI
ncbi:metallo-beta-lactamase [Listeria floridensis FSL S10-1187]|uniref:Ribonuclease Z n=1 Tax=Listeria floridensis FSL S10-1187 TaxID=1265817 RepID=A0ABP3B0A3_9LIST|nr:ribonuclease Z [Listeria floridensis]EUJ32109.1 metallo-beta-lactamase [Listeria floridensis FSL S10-1187]